jgi:hypothetical protein
MSNYHLLLKHESCSCIGCSCNVKLMKLDVKLNLLLPCTVYRLRLINLNCMYRCGSYHAVNRLRLGYVNRQIHVVW